MKVVIYDIIHSPIAAFHNDGLAVFESLRTHCARRESFVLSFAGISRCSTQFLNASLGKVYLDFEPSLVDSLISFDFAGLPRLAEKVDEVKSNAIHSKEYDQLVDEATY